MKHTMRGKHSIDHLPISCWPTLPLIKLSQLCLLLSGLLLLSWSFASTSPRESKSSLSSEWAIENDLDQRLQLIATASLGNQRGSIIVIDPKSGRIRAVV